MPDLWVFLIGLKFWYSDFYSAKGASNYPNPTI